MSSVTRVKSALVWQTAKGRDLIRLDESAKDAVVSIGCASAVELRALAEAAVAAAEQIEAYAMDAATPGQPR